jgi:hypothetical protein
MLQLRMAVLPWRTAKDLILRKTKPGCEKIKVSPRLR